MAPAAQHPRPARPPRRQVPQRPVRRWLAWRSTGPAAAGPACARCRILRARARRGPDLPGARQRAPVSAIGVLGLTMPISMAAGRRPGLASVRPRSQAAAGVRPGSGGRSGSAGGEAFGPDSDPSGPSGTAPVPRALCSWRAPPPPAASAAVGGGISPDGDELALPLGRRPGCPSCAAGSPARLRGGRRRPLRPRRSGASARRGCLIARRGLCRGRRGLRGGSRRRLPRTG